MTKLYPLQTLNLPSSGKPAGLFFRSLAYWEPSLDLSGAVHLPKGCVLDFDTFANAFFAAHWSQWTASQVVALELLLEGRAEVRVFAHDTRGRKRRIARVEKDASKDTLHIALPAAQIADAGRLSFEVAASDSDLRLRSASWLTDAPPLRTAAVDLVICTFNKIELLAPLLAHLSEAPSLRTLIGTVIVVDQGTERVRNHPNLHPATKEAIGSGFVRIVEQGNFGGTGGFARGIIEATSDSNGSRASHVLLMDDDVSVEAGMLARLHPFLERCGEELTIGGSMLDLLYPERLFAFTERFDVSTAHCERNCPFDVDLRRSRNLRGLMTPKSSNYNGWFICCFPKSVFARFGLPLPIFVRGDDVEFGLRLTSAGVPLTHMPGLAVWHEPFYGKPRPWIEYYSYRNQMIVANLYSIGARRDLAFKRFGACWFYISTYQYGSALAVCMAVEDFLIGPTLFGDPRPRHEAVLQELSRQAKRLQTSSLRERGAKCPAPGERPRSRIHPRLPSFIAVFANAYWNLFGRGKDSERVGPVQQAVQHDRVWWRLFHEWPVVAIDNAKLGTSVVVQHDAREARRIFIRIVKATARHLAGADRLNKAYKEHRSTYTTRQSWLALLDARHLGKEPAAPGEHVNRPVCELNDAIVARSA